MYNEGFGLTVETIFIKKVHNIVIFIFTVVFFNSVCDRLSFIKEIA